MQQLLAPTLDGEHRTLTVIEDCRPLRPATDLFSAGVFPVVEWLNEAQIRMHRLAIQIQEAVVLDQRFSCFPQHQSRRLRTENGTMDFFPNFFGMQFLMRLLRTADPEGTIQWLLKVLTTEIAIGQSISALWGVPVTRRIDLTQEVALVPIEQIPSGPHKTRIMNGILDRGPIFTHLSFERPQSALTVEVGIDQREAPGETMLGAAGYLRRWELFNDIILSLTMIGPRVVTQAGHWFTFCDPDLEDAHLAGGSVSQQGIEILPMPGRICPPLDSNFQVAIIPKFLNLPSPTKDRVRLGLQRLSQSLRRRGLGDRALELSTAFEATVSDSGGEVTHKVSTRTARLLGGSSDERRKTSAVVKECYAIRSSLVHRGSAEEKSVSILGQRFTRTEVLEEAAILLTRLLHVITERGSTPEWPTFDVE